MTGRYTPAHGIFTVGGSARGNTALQRLIPTANTEILPGSFVTLAECLKSAGYTTCHAGKWHLGEGAETGPEGQGFDRNIGGCHAGSPPGGYFAPWKAPGIEDATKGEHLCDHITGKALDWLQQQRSEPFFLYLAFYDVHTPLQAKPELIKKYAQLLKQRKKQDGPFLHEQATYAAMMETADTNIGRVLDWLDASGKAQETIVILTSDNGGYGGATRMRGLRGAKGMYYEGGIRVPMAIRWPGRIAAGSNCAVPVQGSDLFPTLAALAQAGVPSDLVGQDLRPLLLGTGMLPERDLFWHSPVYLQDPGPFRAHSVDGIWRSTPCSVIMRGDLKLIHYAEDDRLELYDLAADPEERQDLALQQPEQAAALRQRLEAWRSANQAPWPDRPNPAFNPQAYAKATAGFEPFASR
jgi:arylsulfatase A-like enzyme